MATRLVPGSFGPRLVLGCGLALILGVFVLEMSHSAARMAGSDRVSPAVFASTVPGGGTLCQSVEALPADARRVQLLVGTYGRPEPDMSLQFYSPTGKVVASGSLAGGGMQDNVTIPLTYETAPTQAASMCLRVGGSGQVAIGGEIGGAAGDSVNGKHGPGVIHLAYLRAGSESWWQLLPTLVTRFGLGKSSLFGDWTLPAMALLFVSLWVFTVRFLARELT